MSGDSSQNPRKRWTLCLAIGYLLHKVKLNQISRRGTEKPQDTQET